MRKLKIILDCKTSEACRTNTNYSLHLKYCNKNCTHVYLLAVTRPACGESTVISVEMFLKTGAVSRRRSKHPESEVAALDCSTAPKSPVLVGKSIYLMQLYHKGTWCYSSGMFQFNSVLSIKEVVNCYTRSENWNYQKKYISSFVFNEMIPSLEVVQKLNLIS